MRSCSFECRRSAAQCSVTPYFTYFTVSMSHRLRKRLVWPTDQIASNKDLCFQSLGRESGLHKLQGNAPNRTQHFRVTSPHFLEPCEESCLLRPLSILTCSPGSVPITECLQQVYIDCSCLFPEACCSVCLLLSWEEMPRVRG